MKNNKGEIATIKQCQRIELLTEEEFKFHSTMLSESKYPLSMSRIKERFNRKKNYFKFQNISDKCEQFR